MRLPSTILTLLAFASILPAADLTTLNGRKLSGELVSIDDKAVVIKSAGGNVSTPLPQILQLILQSAPSAKMPDKYTDVELIDGTILHCSSFALKGKNAELTVLPDLKLTIPMRALSYILTDAQDPANRKDWAVATGERTKSDRYFVRRNNRLDGLEGTFGDASADGKQIDFTDAEGRKRPLPIERLVAFLFNNRLEGNIPTTACRVKDAYNNVVVAHQAVLKGEKLSITTVAGATVEYPSLKSVAMLDYSKDKIVYLSDMKPAAEEKDFDELSVMYSKDLNLDNQQINLEGKPFHKGLVLHPPLVLTYDIGGEYKEFKAVIGVDVSVQTPSHVRLIFEADGRKLFETEVNVKDHPRPITLDIKKVHRFKVRVLPEGFPYGHQVTLADAKVTK